MNWSEWQTPATILRLPKGTILKLKAFSPLPSRLFIPLHETAFRSIVLPLDIEDRQRRESLGGRGENSLRHKIVPFRRRRIAAFVYPSRVERSYLSVSSSILCLDYKIHGKSLLSKILLDHPRKSNRGRESCLRN